MSKIHLLIADDHAVVRSGLRALLAAQGDLEVVAEADSSAAALEAARRCAPDVIILDVSMPGGDGLSIIEQLRSASPKSRVLVLTMHDDHALLRLALARGVAGFLTKSAADTDLIEAVRAVHSGRSYIQISQRDGGLGQLGPAPAAPRGPPLSVLSAREQEVVALIARGYGNKEVAEQLALSVKTVETYRARLSEKLGFRGRAELVRYAIEQGLMGAQPLKTAAPDLSGKPPIDDE